MQVTVFERGQSLLSPPLDRYSTSLQVLRACYRAGTDEPALPFALTVRPHSSHTSNQPSSPRHTLLRSQE